METERKLRLSECAVRLLVQVDFEAFLAPRSNNPFMRSERFSPEVSPAQRSLAVVAMRGAEIYERRAGICIGALEMQKQELSRHKKARADSALPWPHYTALLRRRLQAPSLPPPIHLHILFSLSLHSITIACRNARSLRCSR
jgi:hypothetical protein